MDQLPVAPANPPVSSLPDHLVAPAGRYVEAGLRGVANTVKAHAGDWRRFTTWCQGHDFDPLPAMVEAFDRAAAAR